MEKRIILNSNLLKSVSSAEHDRILTLFINLLENTVRTNYYQNNGSNEYISLKFDSKKINDLPKPSPWRDFCVFNIYGRCSLKRR